MKSCKICGKLINDNDEYCTNCGNACNTQLIRDFMGQSLNTEGGHTVTKNEMDSGSEKKSKKKLIIISAIAVCLIAAVVCVILLGFRNPDKEYYMDYFTGTDPNYTGDGETPKQYNFWYYIDGITNENGVYGFVTDLNIIDSDYKFFKGASKVALTVEDSYLKRIVYADVSLSGIAGKWKIDKVATNFSANKIVELKEAFISSMITNNVLKEKNYGLTEYEADRLAACTVDNNGSGAYHFSIKYDITNSVGKSKYGGYVILDGNIEVNPSFKDTDYSISVALNDENVVASNDSSGGNDQPADDSWPKKNPIEGLPDITNEKIYIYSGNNEFLEAMQLFLSDYPEYKKLVDYTNLNKRFESEDYNNTVMAAFEGDKAPSIIVYNEDSADRLNSDTFIDVSTLGLDKHYGNSYQYAVDRVTYNGQLKGMAYLICPSGFFYRKDIAEKVFGTSDPEEIKKLVSDWDKFNETAEKLKKEGYFMLATQGDLARGFGGYLNNANLSSEQQEMLKSFKDNGYYKYEADMWGAEWKNAFKEDVFGYFGALWFFDAAIDIYTDKMWEFCNAPEDHVWEGAYAGITANCTNPGLAAMIMYGVCCDPNTQYNFAMKCCLTPNNTEAAEKIIKNGDNNYHNTWFDGNMAYYMDDIAKKLKVNK